MSVLLARSQMTTCSTDGCDFSSFHAHSCVTESQKLHKFVGGKSARALGARSKDYDADDDKGDEKTNEAASSLTVATRSRSSSSAQFQIGEHSTDLPRFNSHAHRGETGSEWPVSSAMEVDLSLPSWSETGTSASSHTSAGDLCTVCGDKASGFHYNACTCEGCKGFFRRSIMKQATYSCKYGGNCEMDAWMRRKCPACRLRRCFEVGMKQECLIIVNRSKSKESMQRSESGGSLRKMKKMTLNDPPKELSPLEQLTDVHKKLIEEIVTHQETFEVPNDDDLVTFTGIKVCEDALADDVSGVIYQHMMEMTMRTIHLVVQFAKHLPGFIDLCKDTQIVLLKGSASEVMLLRTARRYNPERDEVIFGDGTPVTRESLCVGGLPRMYVDDMFNFAISMSRLAVDNAEYALLTAICIFSDRQGIINQADQVDCCRDRYSDALVAYNYFRRPNDTRYLARLLMMLVELRTLSHRHAQVLRLVGVERGELPPLLSEYFDMFE